MSGTINFNGADTDPLPSPFASATGWATLRRLSNECANSAGSDTDAAMRRTDSTATRSIVEYRSGTFDGGPAFLDSSGNGYISTCFSGTTVELYKVTGGPNYQHLGLDGAVTFSAGDLAELSIEGDDLVFYKGVTEIFRHTDTTFRTGLTPAIFMFAGNLRLDNHSDGASGSQDINVGLTSETDTAFSVGKFKSLTPGLNTETDTAFTIGPMHMLDVGLVEESDTAFSIGKTKTKAVGLNTETDTALSVMQGSWPTSYFTDFPDTENPIDQDGAFRVGSVTGFYKNPRSTPGKCFAADFVGAGFDDCLAALQNHAVPVDHRVTITVFRAPGYTAGDTHEIGVYIRIVIGAEFVRGYEFLFEASGSFQVVRWEGISQEFDNFFTGISLSGPGPGTLANEDEIAVQVEGGDFEVFKNGVSVITCSDATFEDGNPGMGFFVRDNGTTPENFCLTSWAAAASTSDTPVGLASETDTAFGVGKHKTVSVGLTAETNSAFAVSKTKRSSVGLVTETDSAQAVRSTRVIAVGLPAETDSVFSVSRLKSRVIGLALEGDGAYGIEGGEGGMAGGGYYGVRLGLGLG